MAKILIVEDDICTNEAICEYMRSAGHITLSALDGEQGLQIAREKSVDLVVLDIMLPKRTGLEVLKELRQISNIPILMLTALDDEPTQAASFDEQADDYITKPFGTSELLARVRTALRHSQNRADINASGGVFRAGKMRIDYDKRRVTVDGADVHLTQTEYNIVALLSRHAGRVLTYDFVMRETWGPGVTGGSNQILRVNMANIRRKLEKNPAEPEYIFTETGVGYRMLDGEKE